MKMTANTEIKGIKVELTFEGSIKELMAVNTATIKATQEWVEFFGKNGDRIFNMLERAVDRTADLNKKVILKEKEEEDFRRIIK